MSYPRDMSNHLLIIGYVWPEPNSSAAGHNMLGLIQAFLRNHWRITFASAANQGEHCVDLNALGVATLPIQLNCDSIENQLAELAPTAVVFDRYMTEEQFSWRVRKICPNAVHILNTEDLHSLRDLRQHAVKNNVPVESLSPNTELAQREVAAILRSDLTLIISSAEIAWLQQHYKIPAAILHHFPLQLPCQPRLNPKWQERAHFMTIGNFRHAPNWDAVLQIKQSIWPAIRKRLPKAELHIYGAYLPPKASALHNPKQGFLVKGWASDSQAVMRSARVCLAPLRFGAGVKGKLIEAASCGTPSVTTEVGIEGLTSAELWPGYVVNWAQTEAFADAAVKLHEDEAAFVNAQQLGYQMLETQNCTEPDSLVEKVADLAGNLVARRAANFYQGLLWHQTLRSTQYFAQWIEAKNRNQ